MIKGLISSDTRYLAWSSDCLEARHFDHRLICLYNIWGVKSDQGPQRYWSRWSWERGKGISLNCFKVEVLQYILQSLFRISEVPVMMVWCREVRWWWILNRKECVFVWSGRSFLWLWIWIGIVFWLFMWWFISFSNLFQRLWHCFFQGSGMLAGVSCSYSTPEFCSGCIPDKDAVNRKGETLLAQVCLGLPAGTTLDNDRTSWFQILDNHLG